MRPTDHLRALANDDWQAATRHPFCDELASGTLPQPKMARYLVQDHKFIDGFVRLLASAIAHAPSLEDSIPAAQFLAVITGPENTFFVRAFEALGVSDAERVAPPAPTTLAFQDLMADAASSGRYELSLAVLVVAEWSYLSWAAPHHPPRPDLPFWYREWIELHAGVEFEAVVEYLRGQLDSVWATLGESARGDVEQMFRTAVRLEREFFDAAYRPT